MNPAALTLILACLIGATEREQVAVLKAGNPPADAAADWVAAVQRVEKLGGKFEFDRTGNLIGVDLMSDRVSLADADVPCLLAFPHLEHLKLSGGGLTDVALESVAAIEGLTELSFLDAQIDTAGLQRLGRLSRLTALSIRRSPLLDDESLKQLRQFPKLRNLGLLECGIGDAGLTELATLGQLRLLDLRNCPLITNAGIQQLGALKGLKVLRLAGFQITNATLELVGQFPGLLGVSLEDADIDDAGLTPLARRPLEELSLSRCYRVTDEGLRILKDLPQLRQFGLRDIPLSGAGLQHLQGHSNLRRLKLSGTGIDDSALAPLVGLENLERLELRQTLVSDAAVETLASLKNLRYLDLAQTGLTDAGFQQLAQRLPKCEIVR